MVECPTCGEDFETEHGVRVHHSTVHDERLPNRSCAHCDEAFYAKYERKYCSDDCRTTAVSFSGSANPNYRGGKEETTCRLCDGTFEYYPSEKEGVYCPTCVESEQWRDTPIVSGEDHPRWNGGKITAECTVCAETVERYPSNVDDVVTCSESCRRAWLSDEFTGEGHPNWKGGGTGPYGKGWNAVREAALERDDRRCVRCGATKADIGRNPDVHHVVPVRAFVESGDHEKTDAHRLENVVSLCVDCHRKAEFGAISPAALREAIGVEEPADVPSVSTNGSQTGAC